jgi:hypothetical protein
MLVPAGMISNRRNRLRAMFCREQDGSPGNSHFCKRRLSPRPYSHNVDEGRGVVKSQNNRVWIDNHRAKIVTSHIC